MGGRWRERGYDPREWRRPMPRVEARVEALGPSERGIIVAFIVSVVMSVVFLLVLGR